jgi:hypothetical protein
MDAAGPVALFLIVFFSLGASYAAKSGRTHRHRSPRE